MATPFTDGITRVTLPSITRRANDVVIDHGTDISVIIRVAITSIPPGGFTIIDSNTGFLVVHTGSGHASEKTTGFSPRDCVSARCAGDSVATGTRRSEYRECPQSLRTVDFQALYPAPVTVAGILGPRVRFQCSTRTIRCRLLLACYQEIDPSSDRTYRSSVPPAAKEQALNRRTASRHGVSSENHLASSRDGCRGPAP